MRPDTAQMLRDIDAEIHYTRTLIGRDAFAPRVMAAMAEVPRHLFVPEGDRDLAYANGPLPIGWGQTISQPYIVALMTDLLACGPGDRVLEIGTGSGYQAAVLSGLVGQVYSLEIIPATGEGRRRALGAVGLRQCHCPPGRWPSWLARAGPLRWHPGDRRRPGDSARPRRSAPPRRPPGHPGGATLRPPGTSFAGKGSGRVPRPDRGAGRGLRPPDGGRAGASDRGP